MRRSWLELRSRPWFVTEPLSKFPSMDLAFTISTFGCTCECPGKLVLDRGQTKRVLGYLEILLAKLLGSGMFRGGRTVQATNEPRARH
jgi:hypothetical protein